MDRLTELVVLAFAGAGIGRLLARDTLLNEPRNRALIRVGQLVTFFEDEHLHDYNDIAAECRKGVYPLEMGPDITMHALAPKWRAKTVQGATCPSCVAFHAVFWAKTFTDPKRIRTTRWWVELFASWGAASILTRKGG